MTTPQPFTLVPGPVISRLLDSSKADVLETVRQTYLLHGQGGTHNPPSHFLRFDDRPDARIIALPAAVRGAEPVSGIKWIASYPSNIRHNLQRASAVLLLNDYDTGYPIACLEAAQISAARTAASAVLGAEALIGERQTRRLAIVGAGVIARSIVEYFAASSWRIGEVKVHDLQPTDAQRLAHHASATLQAPAEVAATLDGCLDNASCIVFATTAGTPYVHGADRLRPGQVVLNISLRDLAPELILAATNIVDDIDHCLKADTSPHLAEKLCGHRQFIAGTLADVLSGRVKVRHDRPVVFSPFGLGVLDVALGRQLLREAERRGLARHVENFFGSTERW